MQKDIKTQKSYTLTAFTMAEILISLTIIGIIAAITLPSLRANINEKTWATQRKALYSRMSQAISMMPSLNGYTGTVESQAFLANGLSKVLEIKNICSFSSGTSSEDARKEFAKCGLPDKIVALNNSKIDFPTKMSELNPLSTNAISNYLASAFETKNGESVAVFYNPLCRSSEMSVSYNRIFPYMCANFVYDLNGRKGPNKVGKDIGYITALYSTDSTVVSPELYRISGSALEYTFNSAKNACRTLDKDLRLPTKEELFAIFYNNTLLKNNTSLDMWYNQPVSSEGSWIVAYNYGWHVFVTTKNNKKVYCVKR